MTIPYTIKRSPVNFGKGNYRMRKKVQSHLIKLKKKAMPHISNLKRRTIVIVSLLGIGLLFLLAKVLYGYFSNPGPLPILPLEAQTIVVKSAPMPEVIQTIGSLIAKTEVDIKAITPGRMQQILVDSGSWVKKGTLLANIVGAPEIRAPFDGYLTDWEVDEGEYVSAGMELIGLVDTDLLSLTYRVPELYAGKLDADQVVEVSVRAFPDRIFQGHVRYISPMVDKKTYTIQLRAEVKNSDQTLWPGMSAHVTHIIATHPDALIIPEACLKLSLEGYSVLVIKDGVILKKAVQIGERRQGRVHILSGLNIGEVVILTRTNFMEEGKKANTNEWKGEW